MFLPKKHCRFCNLSLYLQNFTGINNCFDTKILLMANDNKIKHLEFIQNVITRMNSNSFMVKGWCVTLISALFALSAKDCEVRFAAIAYFIIPIFWGLDGFFLASEKTFRRMYDNVRVKDEGEIDFNLKPQEVTFRNLFCDGIFTKTLIPFYAICLVAARTIIYVWG